MTREYPPNVYGGAGVHVEYLSRELAKKIDVEVHCWGDQSLDEGHLHVRGSQPWSLLSEGTQGKYKTALEALSLNLAQMEQLATIDIVHTHTWYVSMAGFLAKKLFDIPFVLTTHSLEPLRAWKAEQLGAAYRASSWLEKTAYQNADGVVAGTAIANPVQHQDDVVDHPDAHRAAQVLEAVDVVVQRRALGPKLRGQGIDRQGVPALAV